MNGPERDDEIINLAAAVGGHLKETDKLFSERQKVPACRLDFQKIVKEARGKGVVPPINVPSGPLPQPIGDQPFNIPLPPSPPQPVGSIQVEPTTVPSIRVVPAPIQNLSQSIEEISKKLDTIINLLTALSSNPENNK